MTMNAVTQHDVSGAAESDNEEYTEELGECASDMISECCGTTTVKDRPAVTDEDARAANRAYNAQRRQIDRGH